jgi:hypothetical protein
MYIYAADVWCDSCGKRLCGELRATGKRNTGDSNDWPQEASFPNETDSPSHCAAWAECLNAVDLHDWGLEDSAELHGAETPLVGALCALGLTTDGYNYTREMIAEQRTAVQRALHTFYLATWPSLRATGA